MFRLRDTPRTMSEESTTPDLVELTRRSFAAANRRDWDAVMGYFARHAVWEAEELPVFEGREAIRGLFEDWLGAYQDAEIDVEEVLDLGKGIGFVIASIEGQLVASTAHMRVRYGAVYQWAADLIVRVASDADIDAARTAAERLAQERG
jgi:ketosteroid isomerase-like protein